MFAVACSFVGGLLAIPYIMKKAAGRRSFLDKLMMSSIDNDLVVSKVELDEDVEPGKLKNKKMNHSFLPQTTLIGVNNNSLANLVSRSMSNALNKIRNDDVVFASAENNGDENIYFM